MSRSVTVVGAGVVGMATASYLRRDGHDVTVLDPLLPGEFCSFGNAGILSPASCVPVGMPGIVWKIPGYLSDPLSPLSVKASHALRALPWFVRFLAASRRSRIDAIADALRALLAQTFDAWIPLLQWAGVSDLMRRDGYVVLYENEGDYLGDALAWEMRRNRGVVCEVLDAAAIRALEPGLRQCYPRGVFLPEQGHIRNPLRLTQALATQFQSDGGIILRQKVLDVEVGDRGPHAVVTDAGRVSVDTLVVCAGVHSNALMRKLDGRVPLESQRGYHVQFETPTAVLSRPVCSGTGKFFVTPMEQGTRIAGSVEFAGISAAPNLARAAVLGRQLEHMVPAVAGSKHTEWSGHRPCMPDSLPVIGRSPQFRNVLYAFGHGHIGLCGAAPTGRIIADLLAERRPSIDIEPFRVDRFHGVMSSAPPLSSDLRFDCPPHCQERRT